jgi:hypothetical protein
MVRLDNQHKTNKRIINMTGVTLKWLNSFHQGVLLEAHEVAIVAKPHIGQWGDSAGRLISLVNLREVAARIPRGEELSARITAAINGIVENITQFPNPDDPGNSPYHGSIPSTLGWQWPPGPPPGPLKKVRSWK